MESLIALLQQEREEDRKQYIELISALPLSERVEKGHSWYPLNVFGSGYTVGDRAFVVVERTTGLDTPHQMRSGMSVRFFTQVPHTKFPEVSGTVNYIHRNKMKIVLNSRDLPEWLSLGQLGVDTLFDERSYQEMNKALRAALEASRNRFAELRDILLGKRQPSYREDTIFPDNPHLNRSQNDAIRRILATYDVAVLHGPPGTGKTTTLVAAIKELSTRENTILVCAPSNAAADLLTERLSEAGLFTVRIGNISRVDESVVRHTFEYRLANHEEARHLKKLRIKAAELRKKAARHVRSFGPQEREERKELRKEADDLVAWANALETRLTDQILSSAQAITCTLVGAAHPILDKMKFRTCFIDEAAQALEPATWIPISKCSRLILAGDPFQLPPTVKSFEAAKNGLSVTLIERCLELFPQDVHLLNTQYRMNRAIMGFSNRYFYDGKLIAHDSVAQHRLDLPTIDPNMIEPVVFVDTAGCGFEEKAAESKSGSCSKSNPEEALILREHLLQVVHAFQFEGRPIPSIGIITPYREHVVYLTSMILEDEHLKPLYEAASSEGISINTVDGFQGQERDIVYISLVRSNPKGEIGFLSDYRRMNVAMTRARKLLVIVGDSGTIGNNKFYSAFLDYCTNFGSYQTAWVYMR